MRSRSCCRIGAIIYVCGPDNHLSCTLASARLLYNSTVEMKGACAAGGRGGGREDGRVWADGWASTHRQTQAQRSGVVGDPLPLSLTCIR